MNKQQLSEALAAVEPSPILDLEKGLKGLPILAAARLVERLLPGECPNPMHGRPFSPNAIDVPDHCPDCVDGQVWDEGIVEAVAKVLAEDEIVGPFDTRPTVRAVLSALVEVLTEKVET